MTTITNILHERSLSNLPDFLYFSSGNASTSIGDDLVLLFSIVVKHLVYSYNKLLSLWASMIWINSLDCCKFIQAIHPLINTIFNRWKKIHFLRVHTSPQENGPALVRVGPSGPHLSRYLRWRGAAKRWRRRSDGDSGSL